MTIHDIANGNGAMAKDNKNGDLSTTQIVIGGIVVMIIVLGFGVYFMMQSPLS